MRKFTVEEPIEKNRHNDSVVVGSFLYPLYNKITNKEFVNTGANASQTVGQETYVELIARKVQLDPYAPYIYIDKNFQTPKK